MDTEDKIGGGEREGKKKLRGEEKWGEERRKVG